MVRSLGPVQTLLGFAIRPYAGTGDLPGMVAVINAARAADGLEDRATVAEMAQQYEHLQRCDPATDIAIVESEGEVIGYARTTWDDVSEGYRAYWVVVEAHPDRPELAEVLFDWVEARAGEVAASHPPGDKRLAGWAAEDSTRSALFRSRGYEAVRFGAEMVRPDLEDIPDLSLPAGVEMRPVEESHLRAIWEADVVAFRDHRGNVEPTETDWEAWLDFPHWDPSLWRVAWAGDAVVGQVRNFIDAEHNETFGRLRGFTEFISTAREWRRQGIAGALISSSLHALKERGMTEAALGVDTENPNGALGLYESLGFVRTRLFGDYEKEMLGG